MNYSHRSQITPNELICLDFPFSLIQPFSQGMGVGLWTQYGELLCILHKAQVWTAYALASTISKSFKLEDLSWANFTFSLNFFFWEKKPNYAIVNTPGYIWRRGISVLKCPECYWVIFLYMDFSCMYSQPTPWNVIPTFCLRQTWVVRYVLLGMYVLGVLVFAMLLLPSQESCHPISPW